MRSDLEKCATRSALRPWTSRWGLGGVALGASIIAGAACDGALRPEGNPTPFVRVVGTIEIDESLDSSERIRMAVRWSDTVLQEIPVTLGFPATFDLAIQDLPDESVLYRFEGYAMGIGKVLVYADRNKNNRLDLVSGDDAEPIDRLFGPRIPLSLLYLEGDVESAYAYDQGLRSFVNEGLPLQAGYTLFSQRLGSCGFGMWAEVAGPTDVSLFESEARQVDMCLLEDGSDDRFLRESSDAEPVPLEIVVDEPTDLFPTQTLTSTLTCDEEGLGFTLELDSAVTWENACDGVVAWPTIYTVTLGGISPPDDWPCAENYYCIYSDPNDSSCLFDLGRTCSGDFSSRTCVGDEGHEEVREEYEAQGGECTETEP